MIPGWGYIAALIIVVICGIVLITAQLQIWDEEDNDL